MYTTYDKRSPRMRRKIRIRSKISGQTQRPRLSVFRSEKYISAQLIDDSIGKTLVSASDKTLQSEKITDETYTQLSAGLKKAFEVGFAIATLAKEKKVSEIVFDKSGYKYHGRVKALAEGARFGGLKF